MDNEREKKRLNPSMTRRTFIQVSGVFASMAMTGQVFKTSKAIAAPAIVTGENLPDNIETADDIIYSVCQMCHSRCGIRAKVKEGILVKLDGNPYHPNNRDVDGNNQSDRLPYNTTPADAVKSLGRLCLKGQAGVQTVYDPFRIQHPLKRVGPRNSGQWVTISWDQAFSEIAAKINQLIPPDDRDQDINPSIPELGTKRNQLAFAPGRSVEKELSERIWKSGWGTANYNLDHTSVCEASRHVANGLITWDPKGTKTSMGGGRNEGWQPDIRGARFIIFFGANPLEADFPMVGMARNLMQFKRNGGRYVVVDPRFNNTAAKANQWVPIIPGTDAALAMGMINWILEKRAYDSKYLQNTHKEAATADNEPTWSDAAYLVGKFIDSEGKPYQRYITAQEARISNGTTILANDYVVWSSGLLKGYNQVLHGDLEFSSILNLKVNGVDTLVETKSAFTLLKESAFSLTRSQYAAICGVSVNAIESLAQQFVGYGKKAVATSYRGPVKHTNGLYNHLAIQHLNTLIGNYDWKGGCTSGAGGWSNKSGIVSLDKVAGDPGHDGMRIDRTTTFYDKSEVGNLFTGYPAKRPWFPFATFGNYQEVIPSIQDQYPYGIKVLITYWNAWPYSTPALRKIWEATMADETKLPLLVSISPLIGEVAAWADYVLPDSTYLEKFAVPGIPWRVNKGTAFQRPVVGKFDGKSIGVSPASGGVGNKIPLAAGNNYTPALPDTKSVLDIHIGLAKALNLPGVGDNALLDSYGFPVGHLNNSWDWAKAMLQNIVNSSKSDYPSITVEEILSKGGVFDAPGKEYQGDKLFYKYGNIIRIFADPVARTKDSVTGKYYSGIAHYRAQTHSDGTAVSDSGFPFRLITYKTVHHGQGRTNINPWLMLMIPENWVEISARDAATLGIVTGDPVSIVSSSNLSGIKGKAKVTEGLMPGVVAISHHYGHWEQHSRPIVINGSTLPFDPSRGAGMQPTQIMRTDKKYPNVSLQDPIGGSCSFYDTWVKVSKV